MKHIYKLLFGKWGCKQNHEKVFALINKINNKIKNEKLHYTVKQLVST
jgi:hypothetical protein